jgi:hypothetical protein
VAHRLGSAFRASHCVLFQVSAKQIPELDELFRLVAAWSSVDPEDFSSTSTLYAIALLGCIKSKDTGSVQNNDRIVSQCATDTVLEETNDPFLIRTTR